MTVKAALYKLHRWVALGLGLWIGAAALSGTLLAFRSQIEGFLAPHVYLLSAPPAGVSFDKMTASIAERYPDRQIVSFNRDGQRPDEAFAVRLTRPVKDGGADLQNADFNSERDTDLEVFADPETGRILGDRPYWNWLRIIHSFHIELLSIGKTYLGIFGIALFFLAVSGLIIWWPRSGRMTKSFAISAKGGRRRLLRDLHTVGGAIVAISLLVTSLTGIYLCFETPIQKTLRQIGLAKTTMAIAPPAPAGLPFISAQQAVDAATAAFPDYDPVLIVPPNRGRSQYLVQLFPRLESRIFYTVEAHVSAVNGTILSTFDPHKQPAANSIALWMVFLHNGQMLGTIGQVIVLLTGLTLTLLTVTGIWMWAIRKRNAFARKRVLRSAPA